MYNHAVSTVKLSVHIQIRVIRNEHNVGASEARNIGLRESDADWLLFLDDDVECQPELLNSYAEAISLYGDRYNGFVGNTLLGKHESILCLDIKCFEIMLSVKTLSIVIGKLSIDM